LPVASGDLRHPQSWRKMNTAEDPPGLGRFTGIFALRIGSQKAAMNPPAKIRIPAKIAAEIGSKIVSGRLPTGTILEGEVEASNGRNVSRSAYREAVRTLVAKGLVQSRPKVGTRVTETRQWHLLDPDVLSWMFSEEPRRELLVSLFELRKMFEPEAAALAAARRRLPELNAMADALKVMTQETLHTDRGRLADHDFHASLLLASGNPFLISLSTSVTAAVTWSTQFKDRTQRLKRDAIPDHVRVYKAIAASDARAARKAMTELIELAFSDATQVRRKTAPARHRR
jgi:DNA-binding FadR family transcriptional regulator